MNFFSRDTVKGKKSPADDVKKLTDLCREIAAGENPENLNNINGSPEFMELTSAIFDLTQNQGIDDLTQDIAEASKVYAKLKAGDLEVRHMPKNRNSELGHLSVEINAFLNVVQCFMAECTGTMVAVRDGEYYRRILPEGLGGDFLRSSNVINQVVQEIEEKDAIIKDMTHKFIGNVKDMITSTIELAPKANSMSDNANSTKEFCANALKSANETKMSVHTVASAAEELSSSIGEITSQVERSSGLISETVRDVGATSKAINDLSSEVDQISSILNIITEISGQTNLLALNATIEAARAGEAGKGFAVVANEVKSLAQKTAEATDQITSQLQKIQNVTKSAIGTVSHIGEKIDQVKDISISINNSMSEQSAATNEISRSAQMAASSTDEANSRIDNVNEGADETGTAAIEMLDVVNVMSQKTTALQADLDKFIQQVS